MKFLTLADIKSHCRIDGNYEDDILTLYGEAAEQTLFNYIGSTYEEITTEHSGLPRPLYHAALMLVDVSYTHRSPVSPQAMSVVPYTFDILVKPYIKL